MIFILPFVLGLVLMTAFGFLISKKFGLNVSRGRGIFGEAGRRVSRLGGAALIGAFLLAVFLHPTLWLGGPLFGLAAGLLVIFAVGLLDDIFDLPPAWQLLGQLAAAAMPIVFGMRLEGVANPFGGFVSLDLIEVGGVYLPEAVILVGWTVLIINAVNWLDGLDGLAGGVGLVGALSLFFISLLAHVNQPPIAVLAIALSGTLIGFLAFNIPPAKLFLGTTGSWALGFIIAVLSVVAGSKLASAALVLAIPIIDAFWVIGERLLAGRAISRPDFSHLHYRLKKARWSDRKILIAAVALSALLGVFAIILPTLWKFYLGLTAVLAFTIGSVLARSGRRFLI